jgi:putative ABC transport system permease protein
MAVAKLTFSNFRQHRMRIALTTLAIALAVSLVISITTGYASVRASIFEYLVQYMGNTDVAILQRGDGYISGRLLDQIRADRAVRSAVGRLEVEMQLVDAEGKPLIERRWATTSIIGVSLPDDIEIRALGMAAGAGGGWFGAGDANVAVIDQELWKLLQVEVGDTITLPSPRGPVQMKLVGIVHKPQIIAAAHQTVYIPLATLQRLMDMPDRLTRILVDLHPDAGIEGFEQRWEPKLAAVDPQLHMRTARQLRREMDRQLTGVEFMSFMGGTVAMLAATFIIFSTLSMGVSERQRLLAMLRAIGAMKWQIGAVVVLEGVVLAAAGILIGIPLGLLWVKLLACWRGEYFIAGVIPSAGGIAYAAVGAMLAALAASALPAWSAMRLNPIEAISAASASPGRRLSLYAAIAGLALLCVDAAILLPAALPQDLRFYGHFLLGIPALLLGYFLLAPAAVWLIERTVGRIVAAALGIRYRLLAHQLSGAIWRAAGTAAALMVGLAIFVVMQTQGNTLLGGWRLPNRFPDMFIFSPYGLDARQMAALHEIEGIRRGQLLPIAIATPGLGDGFFGMAKAAFMPATTLFLGVDPDKAMAMMELEFIEGSPGEAARLMNQGRHILVTKEFQELKGLGVGDTITLQTVRSGRVDYTIAGVIWSPGIDVFVSMFDMSRQFDQRSSYSVFGSMEDARQDFAVERIRLLAANLEYNVEREDLINRVKTQLGAVGLQGGDVRHIKARIEQTFRRILMLMSTVALAAIGVASLGVTNTIMASIRSRRWQLGILRGLGLTRSQLLRLIIAEGLLLGLVGSALGLIAGLQMSYNANLFGHRMLGYRPPIDIPWHMVWIGVGAIAAISILASLFPAISASRREPLHLLQEGRATA